MTNSKSSISSPSLLPFVFWVSITVSVIVRVGLCILFYPTSSIGRIVRVNDVVISKQYQYGTECYKTASNVLVCQGDNNQQMDEVVQAGVGDRIDVVGKLNERVLGEKFSGFTLSQAIILKISKGDTLTRKIASGLMTLGDRVKSYFVKCLYKLLPQTEAGLAAGMILGAKGELDYRVSEEFRKSGLSHLVVASGYNITLAISACASIFACFFSKKMTAVFVLLFISMYSFIAGGEAAIARAAVMGGVAYVVKTTFGVNRSAKRLFVLVVLGMLFAKPLWFFDIGYQLSVAATFGMLWFAPTLQAGRIAKHIPGFSESLAAVAATAPILAWHFGWRQLSWVVMLTNIPASLLVGPAMALGTLAVFAFLLWQPLGYIVAVVMHPLLSGLLQIAHIGAKMHN